ncbi:hypothetical protein LLH00_08840 [bacterium]|nr:hypothetical protein [bacterium]
MRMMLMLCLVPLLCATAQSAAADRLQTPGARAVRSWYSAGSGYYSRGPRSGVRNGVCPARSPVYGVGAGYAAPACRRYGNAWGSARGVRFSGWTVRNPAGRSQGRTYGYSGRYGSDVRLRFFSGKNLSAASVSASARP